MKTVLKILLSGFVALSLTTAPALLSTVRAAESDLPDPVLARGKTFEIKRSELDQAFIFYRANLAAIGERVPEDRREDLEADLFHQMVLTRLLKERATAEDKTKAREASDKKVEEVKSLFSSETIYKFRLVALGLTAEKFAEQTNEDELRKEVLRREMAKQLSIRDADIKSFYETNSARFEQPDRARAQHILILTVDTATKKPLTPEKKKEKYDIADKLRERVLKGEDFTELAKEYSEDPTNRGRGAEYTFLRGELIKPFEDAVFTLKPGEISPVIEMQHGYYVVKLVDRVTASKQPLEEVSPKIKAVLLDNEIRKKLPEYYEQLKKEAGVQILDQKLADKGTLSASKP